MTDVDLPRIEAAVREILLAVGEDPDRDGLVDTPGRVARAYAEVFSGLRADPAELLATTFDIDHDELTGLLAAGLRRSVTGAVERAADARAVSTGTLPQAEQARRWIMQRLPILGALAADLRLVIVGGERVPAASLEKWRQVAPNVTFMNGYGPTETTIWSASPFCGLKVRVRVSDPAFPVARTARMTSATPSVAASTTRPLRMSRSRSVNSLTPVLLCAC